MSFYVFRKGWEEPGGHWTGKGRGRACLALPGVDGEGLVIDWQRFARKDYALQHFGGFSYQGAAFAMRESFRYVFRTPAARVVWEFAEGSGDPRIRCSELVDALLGLHLARIDDVQVTRDGDTPVGFVVRLSEHVVRDWLTIDNTAEYVFDLARGEGRAATTFGFLADEHFADFFEMDWMTSHAWGQNLRFFWKPSGEPREVALTLGGAARPLVGTLRPHVPKRRPDAGGVPLVDFRDDEGPWRVRESYGSHAETESGCFFREFEDLDGQDAGCCPLLAARLLASDPGPLDIAAGEEPETFVVALDARIDRSWHESDVEYQRERCTFDRARREVRIVREDRRR